MLFYFLYVYSEHGRNVVLEIFMQLYYNGGAGVFRVEEIDEGF